MKNMKITRKLIFVSVFLFGQLYAVDLKTTPVREAMNFQLSMSGWDDEFDQVNKTKENDRTNQNHDRPDQPVKGKSILKAGLLSALVPGAGEYYLGHRVKARYFFAAEAMTWLGYFSFRTYGSWRKDDYINYAARYADARLEGKSEKFHDWVGFYESIDVFNSLGRVGDPDRAYLPNTPENHWRWDSPEHQAVYRGLKTKSKDAYNRANFMLGVALVTRVISIVDAVRDARGMQRRINDTFAQNNRFNYRVSFNPLDETRQVNFTLFTPY